MSRPAHQPLAAPPTEDPRLNPARKAVYGTGDFTVNAVLVSLNIVYVTYFLTPVAGLRHAVPRAKCTGSQATSRPAAAGAMSPQHHNRRRRDRG